MDCDRKSLGLQRLGLIATAVLALLVFFVVRYLEPVTYRVFRPDDYLWLHTVLEFVSVVAAYLAFAVAWHRTQNYSQRRPFWIGIAFLGLALIDLFHTLSYNGMPAFLTPNSAQKAICFWLSSRFLFAEALILCSVLGYDNIGLWERLFGLALAVTVSAVTLLLVAYRCDDLPVLFIEGKGLALLKVRIEYLIVFMMGIGGGMFFRQWYRYGDSLAYCLTAAEIVSIFSELSFTAYMSDHDIYNLLGHVYKIWAYGFIYYGLFALSVRMPYEMLNQAFARLQRSHELSLLGELSGKLAHEIKNSLAMVKGYAQLGCITTKQGRAYELFCKIQEITDDLAALTTETSRFAVSARGAETRIEEVDLGELVKNVAAVWRVQLAERGIDLTVSVPRVVPRITGSSRLLRQVMVNLLVNASQALEHQGGHIDIRVCEEYQHSLLVVFEDDGPGIPESVKPHLFREFFTTKAEGTGQGLLICRQIVEQVHGGQIWVESRYGEGTKVFISLPISAKSGDEAVESMQL